MALKKLGSYNAQELLKSGASLKELRRLYSKRAYEARKRFEKVEAGFKGSETVIRHKQDFKTARELGSLSRKEVAMELAAVNRYLESRSSRASKYGGVREDIIDSFQEHGYGFINQQTLDPTLEFLEDARARGIGTLFPSDIIVEAAGRAVRYGLSKEDWQKNVDYWLEHSKAKKLLKIKYRSSSEDY